MPVFSQRSISALIGVEPSLVKLMQASILDSPYDFTIDQGVRTSATQQKYYSWGRTVVNPNTGPLKSNKFGAVVTNRDGLKLKSNHQVKKDGFGHAVDIYPFKRDKNGKGYLDFNDDDTLRKIVTHIKSKAKQMGIKIVCGMDWKNPYDAPHIELA